MKSLCRALLVLDVLYCLLALAQEGLPGWRMFESVERVDVELRDRDGQLLDLTRYLPRGAHVVDRQEVLNVARFACEKERARAPFSLYDHAHDVRLELAPADCLVHAPR